MSEVRPNVAVLQVTRDKVFPGLAVRAWHRVQERVRQPELRHTLARAIALMRPRGAAGQKMQTSADLELALDGVTHFRGFLSTERSAQLHDMLARMPCRDPWKPQLGKFAVDAAPVGTHVADIPAAPTLLALHQIACDPHLVSLAATYFGSRPYLDSIQAWWSLPGNTEPEEAENYHRDNDGIRFLKFFLYLTDVGENNGPHRFVRGSHREARLLQRRRLSDEEVRDCFGDERMLSMTGLAGDSFMEDTFGIHKGQLPRTARRLLVQFRYSLTPTIFRSPVLVARSPDIDRTQVTSLLHERG